MVVSPEQAAEQLIDTPCMGRRGLLPNAVLHRPDAYIAMDNFYTLTVYEKGAEVVRICERPSYPSSPCDSSRDIPDGFCGFSQNMRIAYCTIVLRSRIQETHH